MPFRPLGLACAVVAVALGWSAAAAAQAYPTKPIRIVAPFLAGGGVDLTARLVGDHLAKAWGQPVVIENKTGGGGNIGADAVAKAVPDGHTLLVSPIGPASVNPLLYKEMPFDPFKDLAPVAMLAQGPNVLSVKADYPAKSVQELIAIAKAQPGKLNYGTPGAGSSLHLASALFVSRAGLKVEHIAYRGVSAVMENLIKGEIQFSFDVIPLPLAQMKAGNVRILAVTSGKRWPALPEVPTMMEAGVPDFTAAAWFAMLAPANTPKAVVDRLNAELDAGLRTDAAKARLDQLGMEYTRMTPDELGRFTRAEHDKWGLVIKAENITAN
ncbi:MAG: Bug family tripartite tricarboxylate transporter substrate binding protein [Rhodospirillales bacterium]